VRNHRIFDRFILTNTFFWPTIWEGFGEVENRFGAHLDDRLTFLQALAEKPDMIYASPQYDDYIRPRVLGIFEYHPDFVLSLWARRFVRALLFPGHSWGIASVENPEASLAAFQVNPGGSPLEYARARPLTVLVKLLQRIWDPLLFGLALLTLAVDRS